MKCKNIFRVPLGKESAKYILDQRNWVPKSNWVLVLPAWHRDYWNTVLSIRYLTKGYLANGQNIASDNKNNTNFLIV